MSELIRRFATGVLRHYSFAILIIGVLAATVIAIVYRLPAARTLAGILVGLLVGFSAARLMARWENKD